jgi:nucleotide-binding universal stress UspA family protein
MISRVLVPFDDSEMARRALEYALEVHPDADITVLTVVGEPSPMMGEASAIAIAEVPLEKAREIAEPILENAREIAAGEDGRVETAVEIGHPARQILNRAGEFDAIVLGTHGGSLSDSLIVGNVANAVFKRSPVPVTVVR